jgi:hypothetical protein
MSHRHHLGIVSLLLSVLLACTLPANGQPVRPVCTLSASELRDMRLRDGTYGILFPVEMSARGDTVLVLGTSGIFDDRGRRLDGPGTERATVGFLLTDGQRTTIAVPAPPQLPAARYVRVRPSVQGWDAVFFVPDRDTTPGTPFYDDGTFWYGRLRAGRWSAVERIGHTDKTVVVRPNSAGLAQSGPLSFAVFFGEPNGPGGVIVWQRTDAGWWRADTAALRFAPATVTASSNPGPERYSRFFPIASIWGEETINVGSLLSINTTTPKSSRILRLNSGESMNDPVIYTTKDTLYASWWEFDRRGPPNVWYQALDPERDNPGDARRRVATGVNEFSFLAVPEGARTRLVWAYRAPDTTDSAEVAVMANGEPKVIGRVAFPFGFMTSGVASGDRSFILATSPRPVPDGEPSASRTLEVRVNCNEGT